LKHDDAAGRVGKPRQLSERSLGIEAAARTAHEADKSGAFRL
jgi:hypothetical protein